MVKHIIANWDEYSLYLFLFYNFSWTPESFDMENSIILSYYKGEDATPTFLYFMDGLRAMKC
jgi:hypothetical protein